MRSAVAALNRCQAVQRACWRKRSSSGSSSMATAAAAAAPGPPLDARPFVVAIDGPAASGKGTMASRLASELHLAHLDTGLLYRGVGAAALAAGVGLEDELAVAELAAQLHLATLAANTAALRGDEAAAAASRVSALPGVRAALLEAQRRFAAAPPPGCAGAVLDGRDIGTVVVPDADVKLFVTADVEVRATRRWQELCEREALAAGGGGGSSCSPDYEQVLRGMLARDARDSARAAAPLRPADDAVLLDTSSMSAEQAYAAARDAVLAALQRRPRASS